MSVAFTGVASPSQRAPPGVRLAALKQQIRSRNPGLLTSARTVQRRRSLLQLHQQQMELMTPESLDPFIEDAADDTPSGHHTQHNRRERTDRTAAEEKEPIGRAQPAALHSRTDSRGHSRSHSRMPSTLPAPLAASSAGGGLSLHHLLPSKPPVRVEEQVVPLKLGKREMRQLVSQLHTQHPALLSDTAEEEKEQQQPPTRLTDIVVMASTVASSVLPASLPSSRSAASSPFSVPGGSGGAVSGVPVAALTPRLQFSQKRVDKFDESVKVMMSFSHGDMESIRTSILQRGGGVNRSEFLAIAVKKEAHEEGYEREVEALAEMFEEIDVNGDGDLQYTEFTSYLVELANGRYDHHHIDQLLHTDYRPLEPVSNDDRIDVVSVRWYGAGLEHFVLFEKGQHRFKLLDRMKKVVRVVRGHSHDMIDSEWLPLHAVLVTSSRDRTLRFWSVDDCDKTRDGNGLSAQRRPSSSGEQWPIARLSSPSPSPSRSSSFPQLNCLSVWPLPSPQVCLCWCKQRLYSADILGRILVWNIDVGEIKSSLHAHDGRVTQLVPLPEEGCIVSAGMDGAVCVWDCSDMRSVGRWRHEAGVRTVCWDAERRVVLSGGDDERLLVWSMDTKELLRAINFRDGSDKEARRKREQPLVGIDASTARRREQGGRADRVAEGDAGGDSILGVSVTGCEALVVSQYGVIRVLDLIKWTVEQSMALPRGWEDSTKDDAEDEQDDDADSRREVKEVVSLRARELVTSHTIVHAASSSPYPSRHPRSLTSDHELVVSAGSMLYSFTRNSAVNHHVADGHPILSALYLPASFSLITASHRSIKVWDCITGRLLKEFHDIVPRGVLVSSVCVDGRGRKVLVGTSDGRVVIYNTNSGALMQQLSPQHDGEVLCLTYIEEVVPASANDGEKEAAPVPSGRAVGGALPAESDGVNKVLCSCQHGVYIHHDEHEGGLSASSYTSLYHSSFHHHADISSLAASQQFAVIASGSADASIILYPANLDGTPLQKIHCDSRVEALLFLHPFRLLLAASGGGRLAVYCFSHDQHVLIGDWRNESDAGEGVVVQHMAVDAATETLYTGDTAGCITAWPLSDALFSPFRGMLADQHLTPDSPYMPDAAALERYFPDRLGEVRHTLVVRAHKAAMTSVSVIAGRERGWSADAHGAAERRERELARDEEQWRDDMKEAYESGAYRTAQLLYEGGSTAASSSNPSSPSSHPAAQSGAGSAVSSSLSMDELLSLLSHEQLVQLSKEKSRILRQLQHELSVHFQQRRAHNASLLSSQLRALDLQHGSPTAVMSSGADGCAHLWSAEDGSCLGSLHQGEVATLGLGTPAQWKYHANMEARKRMDRERLEQCVREVEDERARWKRDEEKRRDDEAIAARLKEEEDVAKEDEDDPNDPLPHTRAATVEQKKALGKLEEQITAELRTDHFQAKIRPPVPDDRTEDDALLDGSFNVSPSSWSRGRGLSVLSLSSAHRSVASVQLDAEYGLTLPASGQPRQHTTKGGADQRQQRLQLSYSQHMKAAIARAVPLHPMPEGAEEVDEDDAAVALAPMAVRVAVAAASSEDDGLSEAAVRAAMERAKEQRRFVKKIARSIHATAKAAAPQPKLKRAQRMHR